ncbi:DUF1659 domain-containing protein [Clostridium tarantellae]|uniref:DUF1659 domain-containing protein n=1 Tax=Clostridium tarantellae TaxID=39493 RepID=A0A6I1MPR1_9CLOT|nr:DUF1659 domain-containing protein [Clostridium tarantellae]MPQ44202.1 DUF1659 domain-containing protein [Clostridium tarantellae]
MATNNISKCALVLSTVIGVDSKGKDIIKTQKFERVKPSTSADNILAVGDALGNLLISIKGQPTVGMDTQGIILE